MKNEKTIFTEISDAEAIAIMEDESTIKENKYQNYRIWKPMLEIARKVQAEKGACYVANCLVEAEKLPQVSEGIRGKRDEGLSYLWYASSQKLSQEREDAQDAEMFSRGYKKITFETLGEIPIPSKVLLSGTISADWLSSKIDESKPFKVVKDNKGNPFFIPKGKRTRGYSAMTVLGQY